MIKILKTVGLAFLFSGKVLAGTLGAPQVPDFNGVSLGLGTGFISIFNNDNFRTQRSNSTRVAGAAEVNRYTDTAVQFNANLGYGKMFKEKTYLGAKAAVYYSPFENAGETNYAVPLGSTVLIGTNTIRSSMKPMFNIDGVLGYALLPRMLSFVEAGVSFSNMRRDYEFTRVFADLPDPSNTFRYSYLLSLDAYKTSYNVGVGLSYLLQQHLFLSFEVLYNDLSKRTGGSSTFMGDTGISERQTRTVYTSAVSAFASASCLFDI